MDKLDIFLKSLGMSHSQQQVYLAILDHGEAKINELVKLVGKPRATVHDALKQLITRGLVSFAVTGKKRRYIASHPERLEALLRARERQLTAALPELTSLFKVSGLRPRIQLFEGPDNARVIHEMTLSCKSKLLCGFISLPNQNTTVGQDYMKDFIPRRATAGIQANLISSASEQAKDLWNSSHAELRLAKFAPDELFFPISMYIYDNMVSLVGTRRENFGLAIESPELATTMKTLFEIIWQTSRPASRLD